MIDIILAAGAYMTLHNCFPLAQGAKVDFRALMIVVLLVAYMSMYRTLKKKKLSPILLIIASATLPYDKDHFTINVPVELSPPFYAWVATFGRSMKILGPEPAVQGMKEFLQKAAEMYQDE